jgi:hypothetical protein
VYGHNFYPIFTRLPTLIKGKLARRVTGQGCFELTKPLIGNVGREMLVAWKGNRITQFKPTPAKGGQPPKGLNNNWDDLNYLSFKSINSYKRSKDKLITLQLGEN